MLSSVPEYKKGSCNGPEGEKYVSQISFIQAWVRVVASEYIKHSIFKQKHT